MATKMEEATRKGLTEVLFLKNNISLSAAKSKLPVTYPAPYGTGKTVGAVPQPKEKANVERGEIEIAKNLSRILDLKEKIFLRAPEAQG